MKGIAGYGGKKTATKKKSSTHGPSAGIGKKSKCRKGLPMLKKAGNK